MSQHSLIKTLLEYFQKREEIQVVERNEGYMVLYCKESNWVLELQEKPYDGDIAIIDYDYEIYQADNQKMLECFKTDFLEQQYLALQQKKRNLEQLLEGNYGETRNKDFSSPFDSANLYRRVY